MDLPRPNFQAAQADPLSVLKPSPPGQGQPQNDIEAFSRHLADVGRDSNQGRTPPERHTDHRDALAEKRRNEAIEDRRETEIREQKDAQQTERETERAEQVSQDKEANAEPADETDTGDTNAGTPIVETETGQIGTPQTTAETIPSDDKTTQPGESDLTLATQTDETSVGQDETPTDETAETNPDPKAAPQDGQASVDAGSKGQEIAQLANIVAQDKTQHAHAAANPHRAIQSPLQSAAGEPGAQTGEISDPKDIAAQAAGNKSAASGKGDDQPLPDRSQSKGLGHEAAAKLAQRKQDHDTPAERLSKTNSAPAASTVTTRPATVTQWLAAFGLRATSDMAALSLNGDQPSNASGNLPLAAQNTVQNSNPMLARFGALPGQAQATQVPVTSIAVHMARNLQNGINRFEIRIDPPELGRIDVQMELGKDGKVTAHMTVDRPETLDLLQRDARLLERALQNAGLDAHEDDLDFSLRDDGTHEQQAERAAQSDETSGKTADQTENPEDDQPRHTTTLTLAADGRIDIRV